MACTAKIAAGVLFLLVMAGFGLRWFSPSVGALFSKLTTGSIYVSGPQIYTRERLVNDRYREDAWLTDELRKAPDRNFGVTMSTSLIRADIMSAATVVGQDKPAAAPDRTKPEVPSIVPVDVSPQDRLNALRAYREQIRTSMIENQLDDRHDLRGNSLYRVRFEAAVLPGANTQAGARVTVSVLPPDKLLDIPHIGEVGIDPERQQKVNEKVRAEEAKLSRLQRLEDLGPENRLVWARIYARWLESLNNRFEDSRTAVMRAYDSNRFGLNEYDTILANAREDASIQWDGLKRSLTDPANAEIARRLSPEHRAAAMRGLSRSVLEPSAQNVKAMQAMRDADANNERLDAAGHAAFKREIDRLVGLTQQAAKLAGEAELARMTVQAEKEQKAKPPPPPAAVPGCEDLSSYGADTAPGGIAAPVIYSFQKLMDGVFEEYIFNTVLGLGRATVRSSDAFRKFAQGYATPGSPGHAIEFREQSPSFVFTNNIQCFPEFIRNSVEAVNVEDRQIYYFPANITAIRQFLPDYDPKPDIAEIIRARWGKLPDSSTHVETRSVNAGLINFIRMAGRQLDVFSYAFTPSEPDELNAVQLRDENARTLAAEAAASAMGKSMSGSMKSQHDSIDLRQRNALRKLVVSFGEQPNSVTARFGWVIQPQEPIGDNYRHRASQTSLTALVSLPAWWEEIRVNISLSWDGVPDAPVKLQDYVIVLPVNFETVDASLFEANDRSPVISGWSMNGISVTPCQKTEITIPGRRLWRSTVVTLGGQRADGIYVMPDMNGIVATFQKLDFPSTWTDTTQDYKAPLTVWTSQGSAPTQWVTFRKFAHPPDRACGKSPI